MTTRKKLIEVALPLEAINAASAREKSIRHGHPSTLHLWWARRPLAACRAVLFASLVDDPSAHPEEFPTEEAQAVERQRLFEIIERLVKWENSTNQAVLEEARAEIRRSTNGNPPPVLDPFCGGGSIPLEAQRLGLTAYASDLNPVAVLITKALIEIPPKFADRPPVHPDSRRGVGATGSWRGAAGLAEDVRRYGVWMRDEAERRIGHLYPKVQLPKERGGGEATVIAWLWARTVTCPNPACGAQMPLVRSFTLSTKRGNEAWVEPAVDRASKSIRFIVKTGVLGATERDRIAAGTGFINERGKKVQATFLCIVCAAGIARGSYIDEEAGAGRVGAQALALVAEAARGRVYLAVDSATPAATAQAGTFLADPAFASKLPSEPARGTFASNAQGRVYGFKTFKDYFTPRQVVALTTFADLVGEARESAAGAAIAAGMSNDGIRLVDGGTGAHAYADAIATYLAFALDKGANLWSSITSWMNDRGAFRETFARQAIPMVWDFAEANPFSAAGGNVAMFVERIADVLDAVPASSSGQVRQLDATEAVNGVFNPLVATDPPYYDNIGYADLSDFFYVWLRRSLRDVYPDLFSTVLTPKQAELVATTHRFGGDRLKAEQHFERGLGQAFQRMRDVADPAYPLTLFYAFRQSETIDAADGRGPLTASTGWETMLEALMGTGFAISGTWPMRTEGAGRILAKGTNALASSIVLACRPRATDAGVTSRRGLIEIMKRELPSALRTLQHGNIAPVDLAQASIGPGMAIFSRYAKVLEPDGSPMRVRAALALINEILDEIVAEQEGEFDAYTRWAVTWFQLYRFTPGPYGKAETLSNARDISVEGLVRAGILRSGGGKVRLFAVEELPSDWDPVADRRPTVWEATHHMIRARDTGGEPEAARLVTRISAYADAAKDLAYRLYLICERKGWADEATRYNDLIASWPEMQRLALKERARPSQASLDL